MKGREKVFHGSENKKVGVANLISDKKNFKTKNVRRRGRRALYTDKGLTNKKLQHL